jgi:putative selenate reductase
MVNTFSPPSLEQLLKYILKDLNSKSEIFGISEKLFYKPWFYHVLYTKSGGKFLHNPLGLASGPHTQLAQNIVAGWLCGARFIELKTVNETNYTKQNNPSIDVPFEGYNCGSSHELPVREVFDQYLNAWILIHILHNRLYKSVRKDVEVGTVFNMSLGSSLIQVRSEEILWFIDKMMNCSEELENKIKTIKNIYPLVTSLKIPTNISNSVTLSVEQGSVPREIEYVVKYLMMDKKLHTTLKLNPTLLGVKSIRALLNKNRGYDVHIPDSVFALLRFRACFFSTTTQQSLLLSTFFRASEAVEYFLFS